MEITDGRYIGILFSEPLIGDVSSCPPTAFKISWPGRDYVPGGEARVFTRTPVMVLAHPERENAILLEFDAGNLSSVQNAAGADITVVYAGGNLIGAGGAVAAFERTFTPEGLAYKGDQNDAENITVSLQSESNLTRVYHTDTRQHEHVTISGPVATCALIHIDDI